MDGATEHLVRRRRRFTQVQRRALSDQRMLHAAIKLFARRGSSATTLAEIGEAAGYTYGLVTNRFGSKAALVRAVTRHLQSIFTQRLLEEAGDQNSLEVIKTLIGQYLARPDAVSRRAMYVLIGEALGAAPEIRPDIAEADAGFRNNLQRHLERGIAHGEIRAEIDPAAQAALLVANLRGLWFQRLINPAAFDLEAVTAESLANFDKILRPSRGGRGNPRKIH